MDCKSQKTITEMPIDIEEWKDFHDEKTMFSPSLVEKGITPWSAHTVHGGWNILLGLYPSVSSNYMRVCISSMHFPNF